MGLFDTSNAYGGGAQNTQVMSSLELAELRTLPPTARRDVLPKSRIPEQVYGTPGVFYILSIEKHQGLNIDLSDRYLQGAESETGDLNHITHEGPRHITFDMLDDYSTLPAVVKYQIDGVDKIAYTNARQVTPKIINFSDVLTESPMFSALAPEGKEEITLSDVPSSTLKVVRPDLQGMTVTSCVSGYDYQLFDADTERLLNEALAGDRQQADEEPRRSI
jgi:hypothetical protein